MIVQKLVVRRIWRAAGFAAAAVLLVSLQACSDTTTDKTATEESRPIPPPPQPLAPPPPPAMMGAMSNAMALRKTSRFAPGYWQPANTSKYPHANPNPVKVTANDPVSTFSIDVDTTSYSMVRSALNYGRLPQADQVRVEEMVNYFDYAYPAPQSTKTPFKTSVRVYPTPWNANTKILHIGIKGYDIPKTKRPPANLVFLIDTSGSMNAPNKLPLLVKAFRLLASQMSADDRVSIVAYAGSAGVVLPPTRGSDRHKIMAALNSLSAGGSTAGGAGIQLAYKLVEENMIKGGVNRVLLATDGDFNVGITDPEALKDFVVAEREKGVAITCIGFGNDNYNDVTMQNLAQAGNGNAVFVDNENEGRKVFVQQLGSTLITIAKDVKIQVEFNPARVAEYRLIGYETRALNDTDFNNDKVDAGDIGAGHTVTALYEITPTGSPAQMSDPLRYGKTTEAAAAGKGNVNKGGEYAFVKIRYKRPGETKSHLITRPVTNADAVAQLQSVPADMRFAAAVAGAAQLMRHDPYIKDFSFARAQRIADAARGDDRFGYRAEFVALMGKAKTLDMNIGHTD